MKKEDELEIWNSNPDRTRWIQWFEIGSILGTKRT